MHMTVGKARRLAEILNVDYKQIYARTMYSTKTATTNNQEFNSSYMPVGINENITLKEVNVNRTQNGRDFLEIIFENADGQTATMTEWKNEKNMWIKTDADLQKRDDQQFGRILQVIDACNGGHIDFEGSSFIEMINWVKQQLIADRTPLRLKVTYDKNGYTQVSKNGIFIESMSVAESQIKLWKNDLLERPVKADDEKPIDPLAGQMMSDFSTPVTETKDVNNTVAINQTDVVTTSTSTGADDLPF